MYGTGIAKASFVDDTLFMKLFQNSITRRVNFIIVLLLITGIGIMSLFFTLALTSTLNNSLSRSLSDRSRLLYTAIENFMLPGQANLAVNFFGEIEGSVAGEEIVLYRTDGVPAFTDSSTISIVNEEIGAEVFSGERSPVMWEGGSLDQARFSRATQIPPERQLFRSRDEGGNYLFQIYEPLINKPNCASCHGSNHTIRGLIHIAADISPAVNLQRMFIAATLLTFLLLVTFLTLFLAGFMNRHVIDPVKQIALVCTTITGGRFDARVDVKGNDEIAGLGTTVNTMIVGLRERYELSKYVSSSTIRDLTGSSIGKKVPITVFFSDIRGFTSFSEKLDPETVVQALNAVLSSQSDIISSFGGDIDKYVGDEIMATFTGRDGPRQAAECALAIMETFSSSEEFYGLRLGIGINTGLAILGRIGSAKRADYTVIGDTVNVASRLCSSAPAGVVYVSQISARFLPDHILKDDAQYLSVKGKSKTVTAYPIRKNKEETGEPI
jgi:class 3 adenylate cyclase